MERSDKSGEWSAATGAGINGCRSSEFDPRTVSDSADNLTFMSKRTQKKKAKARRTKANHGRKPNVGRN